MFTSAIRSRIASKRVMRVGLAIAVASGFLVTAIDFASPAHAVTASAVASVTGYGPD